MILAPISIGELFDKITILRIKCGRISAPAQRANVEKELRALERIVVENGLDAFQSDPMVAELRAVNEALWDIEDGKRDCERHQDFGQRFVDLARQVYILNDKRAALKRAISEATGSDLIEEKSHVAYQPGARSSRSD